MSKKYTSKFINNHCDGKFKHTTVMGAEYDIFTLKFNHNLVHYQCQVCGFIHIGKKIKNKYKNKKSHE